MVRVITMLHYCGLQLEKGDRSCQMRQVLYSIQENGQLLPREGGGGQCSADIGDGVSEEWTDIGRETGQNSDVGVTSSNGDRESGDREWNNKCRYWCIVADTTLYLT